MEFYTKACDLKYPSACNNLGVSHYKGLGVEQDYKKAFAFYAKACDLEHSGACYNLGVSYKKGQGVKQNLKRAKDYW